MSGKWVTKLALGVVFLTLCSFFFVLPALGLKVFLSPDETAVAAAAGRFAEAATFRLANPAGKDYPWLHPRSLVTQGDALVPVGFLGMPLLAGAISKLLGFQAMLYLTPLLAISAAYPIWRLTRRLGELPSLAAIGVWMSFPAVVLYANRGLFPNLPVVALAWWAIYLATGGRVWKQACSGILTGLALAIRPTEAVWLLPLVVGVSIWGAEGKAWKKRTGYLGMAAAAVCLGAAGLAWRTYGSPWAIGYFLHDPTAGSAAAAIQTTPTLRDWLPFGIHPRAVWANIKTYLIAMLWPWMILLGAAGILAWRDKQAKLWLGLGAWMSVALIAVYGQARYQDHIGVDIASWGNSFLRYMLPLSVPCVVAAAYLVGQALKRWPRHGSVAVALILAGIIACGAWSGLSRDDEGAVRARPELLRYSVVRDQTTRLFPDGAIILSDRSDKIFYPAFAAASPLPDKDKIKSLERQTLPVLLYAENLDDAAYAKWFDLGYFPQALFSSANQSLYTLNL